MKKGFLGQVRRLLGSVAEEFLEASDTPSRRVTGLAGAQAAIREQLGLLLVEQRRIEKERAAAAEELGGLLDKATFAVATAREDLARAALTHRNALEQKLAQLDEDHSQARAGISALEQAAASLSQTRDGSTAAGSIATQLAELDRLLQTRAAQSEKGG